MSDIKELVDWVAEILKDDDGLDQQFLYAVFGIDHYTDVAKQILSHPKIVILDDDQSIPEGVFTTAGCSSNLGLVEHMLKAGFRKVTSLAEAIKTMEEK